MKKTLVLFVDDEEKVLKAWRRTFADEPYEMLFARNGEEALKIISGLKIGAVVTDYSMPVCNGIKLLSQIRENYPDIIRILVSGQATLKVASEAINACGIYKLFQKPCNNIELALAIREGLKEFNSEQENTSLLDLERKHPGITKVSRDKNGAIRI